MLDTNPILSIIIPTKNRQYTCLFAIESAVRIAAKDIEIIVQDCSDNDELGKQILDRFPGEFRIKYEYSSLKPSMTENWNAAFDRSKGEYLCAIGDDDAVMTIIYELVCWAKENNVLAISQKKFATYTWPGFIPQPYHGTLAMDKYSGKKLEKRDLKERISKYSDLTDPMSYITLPQSYHCIFSREIKLRLEKQTGSFLKATSVDVYTAVAFSSILNNYIEADVPFTLRGASPSSNTQRLFDGRSREHLNEYKDIQYPGFLPEATGLYITVTESFVTACLNTGQEQLIKNIDLPILYANIALQDPDSFQACKQKLQEFVFSKSERMRFYRHYKETKRNIYLNTRKERIFSFIKGNAPFIYKLYRKLFPLHTDRVAVSAGTIRDAIHILEKQLTDLMPDHDLKEDKIPVQV